MSDCPYYKIEEIVIPDKQMGDLSRRPPFRGTIAWCSHSSSPLRKDEKGELPCEGDLTKCTINPM